MSIFLAIVSARTSAVMRACGCNLGRIVAVVDLLLPEAMLRSAVLVRSRAAFSFIGRPGSSEAALRAAQRGHG